MKKIYLIILLFFISIINVDASNLTLKTLKENILKGDIYQEFTEEGSTCTISSSNTYFNISCKLGTEGTYKTNFDYSKGILSYRFDGNRKSSQTYEETLFDTFWLVEVANCIANYYGIDIGSNMLDRIDNLTQNNYTLSKHGVESTYFQYSVGQESGYAFDTFKIYVNDGTVKEDNATSSNTTTNNGTNTNNNNNNNNNTNNNTNSGNNSNSSSNSSNSSNNSSNTQQNNQSNSTQNSNSSFDNNEQGDKNEQEESNEENLTYEEESKENNEDNSSNPNNSINNNIEKNEQQNQSTNQNSNQTTNNNSPSIPQKKEPENQKKDTVFSIKNIFKNDSESAKNLSANTILIILIVIFGSVFVFLITRKPKNK